MSVRWEFLPLTQRSKDCERTWGTVLAEHRPGTERTLSTWCCKPAGAPCQGGGQPWRGKRRPSQPIHSWAKGCCDPEPVVRGTILGKPKSPWRSLPNRSPGVEQVNVGRHRVPEPTLPHLPQCWAPRHLRLAAPDRTRRQGPSGRHPLTGLGETHSENKTYQDSVTGQCNSALSAPGRAGSVLGADSGGKEQQQRQEGLPAHKGLPRGRGRLCVPAI